MSFDRVRWQRERNEALQRAGGRRICVEIQPDANAVLSRLLRATGKSAAQIINDLIRQAR